MDDGTTPRARPVGGAPPGLTQRARRSGPVVAGMTAAKAVLRRWGMATADLRPPPEFLIIGTKRGGTTSLHDYLLRHPGVLPTFPSPEKVKGTYFFDEGWGRGRRWYLSHFPTSATRAVVARRLGYPPITGEATPYYLFHPLAPARAKAVAPEAKIIVLLRDPVERAFSHYKERRKENRTNGTEPLSFADAVAAEAERLDGEESRIIADPSYVSPAHRHSSYVAQSRYLEGLRRWLACYPAEQVLVLRSEDLYADPVGTYDRVIGHLGLPHHPLLDPEQLNAEPSRAMDPEVRRILEDALRDDAAALEQFLGRDMGWTIP